ncbi:MAG TPA: penicillin-insensitive murein endopeptidase [Pseudolabrys sp.]|nr:penicillin-insensitive murein endopeptidase [Pseudolabrys sp.]
MFARIVTPIVLSLVVAAGTLAVTERIAIAQTPATAAPAPLPPQKPAMSEPEKEKTLSAKELFGAAQLPSIGKAMAIGYYPRGCLAGGVELPINGPNWQVMRLSRNRNWGHPSLINFVEKFASLAAKATGWKGILVGDLAQPRGGPSPSDHSSHQTGLDVDIWFMPMPDRVLTKEERDTISASNLVSEDWKHLNPETWTPQHVAFIKTAAQQPGVERVLVNAAIKKELCRVEEKRPHAWMAKVRPWYGHHDHIHVRLRCPTDSPNCRAQQPVSGDDGCSGTELDHWLSDKVLKRKITTPSKPPKPMMLADLPPACKTVLEAPAKNTSVANEKR